ncbi:MAG: hypothetical protein KGY41_10390 [Desulfovermiculus sp.]|nr:hypothetical protein [Desulfovermiculus sp.]
MLTQHVRAELYNKLFSRRKEILEISPRRLQALPWASLCRECVKDLESENKKIPGKHRGEPAYRKFGGHDLG